MLYLAMGLSSLIFYVIVWKLMRWNKPSDPEVILIRAVGFTAGFSALLIVITRANFSPYIRYIADQTGIVPYIAGGFFVIGVWVLAVRVCEYWIYKKKDLKLPKVKWITAAVSLLVIFTAYGTMTIAWEGVVNKKVDNRYISTGEKPNVLILVIDALRADRVDLYGNQRNLTPNIDKYSSKGTVFLNTLANSSWTKPSVMSYFTSRYPGMNPLHDFDDRAPDTLATLAERMREAGYYTRAISENLNVSEKYNYHQGFTDFITNEGFDGKQLLFPSHMVSRIYPYIVEIGYLMGLEDDGDGATSNSAVIPWLKANKDKQYFMYVHYMGPHFPYYPLQRRYSRKGVLQPIDIILLKYLHSPDAGSLLSQETIKVVKDRYDDEVYDSDRIVGEVFRALDEIGGWDNTIVILTSDHGEEFLEHGMGDHGNSMFNELLKLPLIVWLPKNANKVERVEERVQLLDLPPTIYDICGIDVSEKLEGVSLLPLISDDSLQYGGWGRGYYGEVQPFRKLKRADWIYAYMKDNYKLIKNTFTSELKDPNYRLFDLTVDSGETVNVRVKHPEVVLQLKAEMDSLYNYCQSHYIEGSEKDQVKATKEEKRRLRALGYAK